MWTAKLDVVMRQEHRAGEKMIVDYAGQTVAVVDRDTGELREAQIFVAVLGASNYTYAEATWTQTLADWIASHVRAFEFYGGCSEILVPDDVPRNIIREQPAGRGIEDRDTDGGDFDKGLEVGPRALFGTVGVSVRDGGRSLFGEEREDFLVFDGEGLPAFLLGKVEVADMRAPVAHGRSLEGARRQACVAKAE